MFQTVSRFDYTVGECCAVPSLGKHEEDRVGPIANDALQAVRPLSRDSFWIPVEEQIQDCQDIYISSIFLASIDNLRYESTPTQD